MFDLKSEGTNSILGSAANLPWAVGWYKSKIGIISPSSHLKLLNKMLIHG